MLVTVLFSIVALLALAALVLDLAAVRVNRAVSQTVADSAATAAALDAEGFNGRAACETALDYLELNLPEAGAFTGANCLTMTDSCQSGVTPSSSTTATAGSWVATLTYPVTNASPLLTSSAIGQPTQAAHVEDGDPCERFGVSIQSTQDYLFGRLLGASSNTSEIHAVARGFVPDGHQFALNLLILERYDCAALGVNTSGGGGGIVVDAVLNADTGLLDQGFIAVDSDASAGCGGQGVISTSGGGSVIRSDGPDGCGASQTGSHIGPGGLTVGEGCGQIQLLAPGVPGCNWPACTASGLIAPDPVPRRERITRAPVDHRYNCKTTYNFGVGWEIDPCTDTPAPNIDIMVATLGGPGIPVGYTDWTTAGYTCNPGSVVVPPGNYYINCANFRPGDVTFEGGNIIFERNLAMTGSGSLTINGNPGVTEGIVFFRPGGALSMTGGTLTINHATVYMPDHHQTDFSVTGGDIAWSAPTTGVFQDLSLWYDSEQEVKFAGGGALDLDGVFFAPVALISYQGNGGQTQVSAQFVSRRLTVGGNGTLVVRPSWDRAVLFPFDPQTDLIR